MKYTKNGVTTRNRLWLWATIKTCTINEQTVTRCTLVIPANMPGRKCNFPGLGPVLPSDVGRTLVVDFYPDGLIVDALTVPGDAP